MPDTELAVQSPQLERRPSFAPRTIQEAFQFAEMLLASGMLPKAYVGKPPATVVVALQFGMEVGLAPLQALQNIAMINGQPSLWGDAALALCKSYPNLCQYVIEQDFEVIKQQKFARCRAMRRGDPEEVVRTFSLQDAQTGGLLTKDTPWKTYPYRMLQMRARAFALRDAFPDILKGLAIAEEARDYPLLEAVAGELPTPTQETQPAESGGEPIGAPGATAWFKAYKASGWTRADADAFILEEFGIEKPRDSRDIRSAQLERAMQWAHTPKAAVQTVLAENLDAEPVSA
jgi:hypothetical protein